MRKGLLTVLASLLAGAASAPAQEAHSESVFVTPALAPADAASDVASGAPSIPCDCSVCPDACATSRWWFNAEYLLWWIKDSPLGAPLVSTSILSDPEARVVLGAEDVDHDVRHGGRFTFGSWLGDGQCLGLETSYFFLGRDSTTLQVGSAGSPELYIPSIDAATGAAGAFPLALPGGFSDQSSLRISTFLQGAEANGIVNLLSTPCLRLDLLAGFRWLQLGEDLDLVHYSPALVPGLSVISQDRFETQNNFYGGQLGLRTELVRGRWFLQAGAKIALGSMNEVVHIRGSLLTATGPGFAANQTLSPVGIYSKSTNSGRHSRSELAWIPEATVNVGVNVTHNLRAFVGYNFLWISEVVRPGDQIDPTLNGGALFPGPITSGPLRPGVPLDTSSFWAQGINFGVMLRF